MELEEETNARLELLDRQKNCRNDPDEEQKTTELISQIYLNRNEPIEAVIKRITDDFLEKYTQQTQQIIKESVPRKVKINPSQI